MQNAYGGSIFAQIELLAMKSRLDQAWPGAQRWKTVVPGWWLGFGYCVGPSATKLSRRPPRLKERRCWGEFERKYWLMLRNGRAVLRACG